MATYPERVKKMFLTQELNKEGVIAMVQYIKGRPEVVTIDDRLPWGTSTPLFLKGTSDSAYWATMAEKVYAKIAVNYETIGWGWMNESFYILTGVPTTMFTSKSFTLDEMTAVLKDSYAKDFMFTAACMSASQGVVGSHAYSVLGLKTLVDSSGANVADLVLVRNPWGKTEFTGNWSDTSSLWTADLKKQVPSYIFNKNDGQFYMTIADFQKIFGYFTITYYKDDWQQSFYEQVNHQGKLQTYSFNLSQTQEVFVMGGVYLQRQIPFSKCSRASRQYKLQLISAGKVVDSTTFDEAKGTGFVR